MAFVILFTFSENFTFSLRRAQAARGPLLSAPAESRQRQAQGSFTPLRIPGPKWGAGRPPLETPKSSLARSPWPNSSPLRGWSFGAVGESASACALATAAAPPPLRFWGLRPLAPQGSQTGKVCPSCAFEGFAPLPPRFPIGESLPIMRERAWDRARCGFAATPSQISRKLLPRKRLGVPSLPSRGCGRRPL